jgi:hypothetical protein
MTKVYEINMREARPSLSYGCYHFCEEGDNAFSTSHEACT